MGDAALAEAPRAAGRAGATRRGRLLHGADGAFPRHPDGAPRAVRHPGRLLRRRRADEPAGVRRHGHRLQLLPRCRPVGVRPRALELRRRARPRLLRARRTAGGGGLLGRGPGVLRAAAGREGDGRASSTATATSSAGSGWRRWSGSRVARAPEIDFALGGRDFQGDTGNAGAIGDVPFNVFARAISAARVNLNITRRSHATVYASSSCRPFELASAGAAIVSNPYNGIERWFEPGQELLDRRGR